MYRLKFFFCISKGFRKMATRQKPLGKCSRDNPGKSPLLTKAARDKMIKFITRLIIVVVKKSCWTFFLNQVAFFLGLKKIYGSNLPKTGRVLNLTET